MMPDIPPSFSSDLSIMPMTLAILRCTPAFTLVIAICMPPPALFACSAQDVMPLPPCSESFIMASLTSSMDTEPSCMAWYRSVCDLPAPSMASASWFICAGAVCTNARQSCRSGLPFAIACVHWLMALACCSAGAPPLAIALLSASVSFVALPRSPVTATTCCVCDATLSSVVGR